MFAAPPVSDSVSLFHEVDTKDERNARVHVRINGCVQDLPFGNPDQEGLKVNALDGVRHHVSRQTVVRNDSRFSRQQVRRSPRDLDRARS